MNKDTEIIKDNLERRFQALVENKKEEYFTVLATDYFEYLDKQPIFKSLIQQLVNENKVSRELIFSIATSLLLRRISTLPKDTSYEKLIKNITEDKPVKMITSNMVNKFNKNCGNVGTMNDLVFDFQNRLEEMNKDDSIKGIRLVENCDRDFFLYSINKFHNDLLEILTRPNPGQILYSSEVGVLEFNNLNIPISKAKNSDPHYLLKTLFKDKHKQWHADEIANDWSIDSEDYDSRVNYYSNKFYQAGRAINEKVAIKTGVEDFLELTKKSININKKYL